MARSLPAVRQIFDSNASCNEIPGYVDEQDELRKIHPTRVWQMAHWSIEDTEY
jgi:hypothetical protein